MRISSGIARGFSLKSPKSNNTRPATEASRLAIFSSLGDLVEGAKVLDLFAGTASYSLEALSNGATSAVFVEKDKSALVCIRENILGIKKYLKNIDTKVYPIDCFKFKSDTIFDLIFIDPPYPLLLEKSKEIAQLIESLSDAKTIIMLEAPFEFNLEHFQNFEILKRLGKKSKGKPTQIIMKKLSS